MMSGHSWERRLEMCELQVLPIVKVHARYGPAGGKYPERIRVAMTDGTTQWYQIENK